MLRNSATSKTTEDKTIDDIAFFKANFKRKIILDTRPEGPINFEIQDKALTVTQSIEDKEFKLQDVLSIKLTPPYAMPEKGSGIFKSKNETGTFSYEGLCEEIDKSVFEKALKESEG